MFHLNALMDRSPPVDAVGMVSRADRTQRDCCSHPAVKRRAGIELKPQSVDADEVAAVSMVGKYRQVLKSV